MAVPVQDAGTSTGVPVHDAGISSAVPKQLAAVCKRRPAEGEDSETESVQVALFSHGLLAHSSTSISQFPPPADNDAPLSITLHSAAYSEMESYSHTPLAKPATHVHRYVQAEMLESVVESVHVPPLTHGLLTHSSTSTSQMPVVFTWKRLEATVHSSEYGGSES